MTRTLLVFLLLMPIMVYSQISDGGKPLSFIRGELDDSFPLILLEAPDVSKLIAEDSKTDAGVGPYQIATAIPVEIDLMKEGSWTSFSRSERVLRIGIESKGAKALILYYNHFSIPEGGRLFIFSADKKQLLGAFTSKNNPSGGYFATEMIKGDALVLEYQAPAFSNIDPVIEIYQVHYVYRDADLQIKGQSGPCEVNVNCSEGDAWQNEKRSVAKIVLKAGSGTYLCTGALVNNVRQDSTPYFLTARHCGSSASLSDYSQWVFHFNYEAPHCEDPLQDPPSGTITGASLIAQAPDGPDNGSDFKLLSLSQKVPDNFNPYFSGWNRDGQASSSGVGIHHPKGDIKKISRYTDALVSTNYSSGGSNFNGLYWRVVWAETFHGHGVTEGGSSGSPIFDNTGKIVGTLTGGAASCSDLTAPDWYGKFSYHWSSNGISSDDRLSPYLDPDNSGTQSMNGFGYGSLLSANFKTDTTVISIGGRVSFIDQSNGDPESWNWSFWGGSPSNYTGQSPSGIMYLDYGTYDVQLIAGKGSTSDTLLRSNYIRVTPNIYPNPAHNYVVVDFGRREVDFVSIEIFNLRGQVVRTYESDAPVSGIWKTPLGDITAGTYVLRIKTNFQDDRMRLVVY
jgi:hypothetical protein